MRKRSLSIIAAFLFAAVAEAGVEVRSFTVTALPDGTYHYGYRLRLVSGSLAPGSTVQQHVTLYDIPGLLPGTVYASAPWSVVVQYTGTDALDIPRASLDNPARMNIVLKYVGTTLLTAPAEVGSFSFSVPAGPSGPLVWVGQSRSPYTGAVGLIGRVSGPAGK
jgi:hypothetical protein